MSHFALNDYLSYHIPIRLYIAWFLQTTGFPRSLPSLLTRGHTVWNTDFICFWLAYSKSKTLSSLSPAFCWVEREWEAGLFLLLASAYHAYRLGKMEINMFSGILINMTFNRLKYSSLVALFLVFDRGYQKPGYPHLPWMLGNQPFSSTHSEITSLMGWSHLKIIFINGHNRASIVYFEPYIN